MKNRKNPFLAKIGQQVNFYCFGSIRVGTLHSVCEATKLVTIVYHGNDSIMSFKAFAALNK